MPGGSSRTSVLPISMILRTRLLERGAGREAHVDALHRLVDLGEERARQAGRGPDARHEHQGRADDEPPPVGQDRAQQRARSASASPSITADDRFREAPRLARARGSSGRRPG